MMNGPFGSIMGAIGEGLARAGMSGSPIFKPQRKKLKGWQKELRRHRRNRNK